jgi:hypothetical protein
MKLDYVPLLKIQRELQGIPLSRARFRQYIQTIFDYDVRTMKLPPLLVANPMAKEHVTRLLDDLLALDADGVAACAAAEAARELLDEPGDFATALIVADDLKGGWTNRYAYEHQQRFGCSPLVRLPRWLERFWLYGVLWSSEPATRERVRETMLCAVYRMAYVQENGPARTLREKLVQEGAVMAASGCTRPVLEDDDLEYTREVIDSSLEATDMRTAIECLFGDAAARTLGFTPRGLSPYAGLALALHDARGAAPWPRGRGIIARTPTVGAMPCEPENADLSDLFR